MTEEREGSDGDSREREIVGCVREEREREKDRKFMLRLINTLIFLLKFLWFLLLLYLSILSFFSSGLYLHALFMLSMIIQLSLNNGLSAL